MRLYNVGQGSGSQYHPVLIGWPDSDQWPQGGEDDFAETDIGSGQMETFIHWPGNDGSAQSAGAAATSNRGFHVAVARAQVSTLRTADAPATVQLRRGHQRPATG